MSRTDAGRARFRDRRDAGRRLAEACRRRHHATQRPPVVVALPRGGAPVAEEVAVALGAPMDVLIVRKIGCPWQPELGVGAIAEGGVEVIDRSLVDRLGIGAADLDAVLTRERRELARRVERYRGGAPFIDVRGRTVVLVDDGIATGGTVRAAVTALRHLGAHEVVIAVPVAATAVVEALAHEADRIVAVHTPSSLGAVGAAYDDFTPTTDDEVVEILRRHRPTPAARAPLLHVEVPVGTAALPGVLHVPTSPQGIVVFAHGAGSSRHSPRNVAVAAALQDAGFATLLFDLMTPREAARRTNVFDVPLLASRLVDASRWLADQPPVRGLPLGYLGASTGAAAALSAAASLGHQVGAVVSRGGRPDLAADELDRVTAPTLLIVGGRDEAVLELNREAQRALTCPSDLAIVPGATHLFEEPGTLERVSELATGWFHTHLRAPSRPRSMSHPG